MTMISEDGDISTLLSEPNPSEDQAVTFGSDDFLPAILKSIKANEKQQAELSPEEAAWADSCFAQTSELSDVDWGAMRQALLDSLDENPMEGSRVTTESMHDQGTHVLSEAESHALRVGKDTQNDDVDMEQRGGSDDDEGAAEFPEVVNVIRGADEHGKHMDAYAVKSDDGDELVSSEVVDQAGSRDCIFKVWDLDVSVSEDDSELELIKDLKELLRDNKPQEAAYPPPGDTVRGLSEINIDDLVAGLSDLSLQQTSE